MPPSKPGWMDRFKARLAGGKVPRHVANSSEQHAHVNSERHIDEPPTSSSSVVNDPQDEMPSNSSAVGQSSDLKMDGGQDEGRVGQPDPRKGTTDFLDFASIDAVRDETSTTVSNMKGMIGPIQSGSEAISNADNPVDMVDSLSSFLSTLSKFNSVVDKIATIHPYAQAAWSILSFTFKIIIGQKILDDSVMSLLSKMNDVYMFLTQQDLRNIESMKSVIELIYHQTLECSYFIREYAQNQKFRMRLLKNLISETDERVKKYINVFDDLLQQFRDDAAADTLVVVHRVWEDVKGLVEDSELNSMPYAGGAGLNTQKVCLEGTRSEILDEITAWINDAEENTPRVYLLHGNAGTGKSAIAHTIAVRFKKLGRLGSCYCFDRNAMAQQRHNKIFSTIARDISDYDLDIRRELAAAVHRDTSLKNTTDILQQWTELIMKPVETFVDAMVGPIVIVIDALDESGEADSRQQILRILAGKLKDEKAHISRLPRNIRILLTSRALPDIADAFKHVAHVQTKAIDSIPPALTHRDIIQFISSELSDVEGLRSDDASRSLANTADGLFEWARLACAFIKEHNAAGLSAQESFDLVIDRSKASSVPLLDRMYKLTLETIFPPNQIQRPLRLQRFRSVMAQMLGTTESLPLASLSAMRQHFADDDLRKIDVSTIIKPMGALLSGTTDSSATIRLLHASFPEFLLDETRSGEFFIDMSRIDHDLAGAALGVMKDGLKFNICHLPSSFHANSDVADLEERIKENISPELTYSCRFWTDHLRHSQFDPPLANEVRSFFSHERLLFWLECLSLLKAINKCAASMSSLIRWVMSDEEYRGISEDAADLQKFVRMFGGAISFSTPHLYVSALPFSPSNSRISTKFRDKFPGLLRVTNGQNKFWPVVQGVLHGHTSYVNCVVFSPDGTRIASASYDNTIRLWDAETGQPVQQPFQGHFASVLSVAFSPNSEYVVSGSSDTTIRLWKADTGELVHPPSIKRYEKSVKFVVFSPDGKYIVSGSADGTVQIWEVKTGELVQRPLKSYLGSASCFAFSPDGKYIASGSQDKTIRLWNAKTGELVWPPLEGHKGWVQSIAFSPNSKQIVSGSDDRTIRVWDVETGRLVLLPFKGHDDAVYSVTFSPDGKHILSGSGDKTIRMWDAATGELSQPPLKGHEDEVFSVAFSLDGRRIVSGSADKTIRLWDAETEVLSEPLPEEQKSNLWLVDFTPDGNHILSGLGNNTVRLYDINTGELVKSLHLDVDENPVVFAAFSPDKKQIVSVSLDKSIQLWNAETGVQVRPPLEGHHSGVAPIALSPDAKHILSGSDNGNLQIFDAETGILLHSSLKGHDLSAVSVAFSPNGKHLASGSRYDTIRLWDIETAALVRPLLKGHTTAVMSVVFSPDGKYIASGSGDKTIRMWDVETGELVHQPLKGHADSVCSLSFSPDGRHIASGSYDKTIRLWDVETGELVQSSFEGHQHAVWSVAFSPDGNRIVSGSYDGTIRLWKPMAAELVQQPSVGNEPIIFSFRQEHALVVPPELRDDIVASSGYELVDLPAISGWAHITSKHHLLFWFPPTYHLEWYSPRTQLVIPTSHPLDLSRMAYGSSWENCYVKKSV